MTSDQNPRFAYEGQILPLICSQCNFGSVLVRKRLLWDGVGEQWITDASWKECPRCGEVWDFQGEVFSDDLRNNSP